MVEFQAKNALSFGAAVTAKSLCIYIKAANADLSLLGGDHHV
jgi:hypothetical protein